MPLSRAADITLRGLAEPVQRTRLTSNGHGVLSTYTAPVLSAAFDVKQSAYNTRHVYSQQDVSPA